MRTASYRLRTGRFGLAALIAACIATAAVAAPLTGPDLRDRFAGAELRMSVTGTFYIYESHLWRFAPDGRLHGQVYYVTSGRNSRHVELQDIGRWEAVGDRICTEWQEFYWEYGNRVCFTVSKADGDFVTLRTDIGRTWQGTLHPWRR